MTAILKWRVPVDNKIHKIGSGQVVYVASQYGRIDEVQVWTMETLENHVKKNRYVGVYATGQTLVEGSNPLGAVVVADGNLVWHVVEIPWRQLRDYNMLREIVED